MAKQTYPTPATRHLFKPGNSLGSHPGNLNAAKWGKATRVEWSAVDATIVTIGRMIRDKRLELDISQGELAAAIGGATTTIHYVETAQQNPSVAMIVRIALALGVRPSDLLP